MKYFAYGSNLLTARLQRRVPSARWCGVGEVAGYALRFHMASRDGSAKCDAVAEAGARIWGAVYTIDSRHKPALDAAESLGSGYEIVPARVRASGTQWQAFMYCAQAGWIDPALKPFQWYKQFVLAGARQKRLPDAHVAAIAATPAVADDNRDRARYNHEILVSDKRFDRGLFQ